MATFYSFQTGNWEDGANWASVSHAGTPGASPGVKGTDWPGSGDTAVISGGHTITVTTDLSGEASPVLLQCDNPGTNNGTLKFSPTATTGLKAQMSTVHSSATFNVFCGERTAPIRRGNTCTLTTGANHFRITSGSLKFEAWGQHREHGATDVYADKFDSAASRGATSITLTGNISPGLADGDWLWLVERSGTGTAIPSAELVQIDDWDSGSRVATLTKPLKYAYTTTDGYAFKAKDKLVNTLLAADHTSGADYVLEEDLYPSGTAGGNFLVCRSNDSTKTNTQYPTVSSYNSGTKTITASASSSQSQSKGSLVLMNDFNVKIIGGASRRIGGDTSFNTCTATMAYAQFDTWQSINSGIESMILFNCNLFDCKSINNDTLTGYKMLMYGVGAGQKAAAASEARGLLVGTKGNQLNRCYLMSSSTSGSNRVLGGSGTLTLTNSYFEDCCFYGGQPILNGLTSCVFNRCAIGVLTGLSVAGTSNITGNMFNECFFFGVTATNSQMFDITAGETNIFNKCVFGETSNGKVINNNTCYRIRRVPYNLLMNGVRFASGEPFPTFNLVDSQNIHAGIVRCAMVGMVTNQFASFTPGGNTQHDASGYRSSAPSIKMSFSSNTYPVWFDVPMYLNAGSKTITVYTNPSTGSWTEAPTLLLLPESEADNTFRDIQDMEVLDSIVQSTLTTSTYSALVLNTTIATDGIYILRLWARNGSGTLNWDDIAVS